MDRRLRAVSALAAVLVASAASQAGASEADVIYAEASCRASVCRFVVTVRHADQGWEHYADRFEVLDSEGRILATRVLHHPHVDEQPFTRALDGVLIPEGVKSVRVRAHDSIDGYGGAEVEVELRVE